MKRFLLIVSILVGLGSAGMAVFIATFDVDRYRPQAVEMLQQHLGKPVEIQRLSMGWQGGLAAQAHGVVIYDRSDKTGEALVQLESASAAVRLLPLIRRRVELSYVTLTRPRVRVIRDAEGRINLLALAAMGAAGTPSAVPADQAADTSSAADPAIGGPSSPPVSFNIAVVRIQGGALQWTDEVTVPTTRLEISHVDVTLRNVSQTAPMQFDVRLALLSSRPNVRVTGRLLLPSPGRAGLLDRVRGELDLATLDVAALRTAAPSLKSAGLRDPLVGRLAVEIEHLPLEANQMDSVAAHLTLADGTVSLDRLGTPIDSIQVDAIAESGRVELKTCSASVGGGRIGVTGDIAHLGLQPRTTLKLTAERLSLDRLLPPAPEGAAQLRGQVTAAFEGTAHGLAWDHISRTLAGAGHLTLTDGKIENLNILREVFSRLSMLPGLMATLEQRLTLESRRHLEARDTVFKPVDFSMTVSDGAARFRQLSLESDAFALTGAGQVGLDGLLDAQLMLAVEPDLSQAIIRSVEELQTLTDQEGRVTIPVTAQGALPRVAVLPDVGYVASKVLMTKAREWLGGALDEWLAPADEPASETAPTPAIP